MEQSAAVETSDALILSVVLAFNNFVDTDECLESLVCQDYPSHGVIVVDNGSTDDSLPRLKRKWADRVRFIENGENLGVAGGYNAGIRAALDSDAQYVVLCNDDIVVEEDFISRLRSVFERTPSTAIAVPLMLYYDRPDLVWFAKVTQHPALMYSINNHRGRPMAQLNVAVDTIYTSDYVPTCASMLSRQAIERVGLLDERFFFGHDDVDWCLRARAERFACNVIARCLVRHKVSVTAGRRGSNILSPRTSYTHAVGSVLIGAKHFRGKAALPFFLGLFAIRLPYNVLTMAIAGRWPSLAGYLRGLFAGLRLYGAEAFRSGQG